MDKIQLKAESRELKGNVNKLRRAGFLPAVLYGHNLNNQHLTLKSGEFEKVLKKAGESTIIELVTSDGKTHSVLIHDIQLHYLTSAPIHVDFYQVSMTEKLRAKVALEFVGEAKAVKELGGVLVKNLNEVEVECLPADLPHKIAVDISVLSAFSDVIQLKDLKVSAKVQVLGKPDEAVAKVQPPRDVEAELTAPVVEDVSKVVGAAEVKPETDAAVEGEVKEIKETKEPKKPVKKE